MMATEVAQETIIDPTDVGSLELGGFEVPYVDVESLPVVHTLLHVGDMSYTYERSFPIKGHSAVMPDVVAALLAQGRQVIVAERNERYYVYLA